MECKLEITNVETKEESINEDTIGKFILLYLYTPYADDNIRKRVIKYCLKKLNIEAEPIIKFSSPENGTVSFIGKQQDKAIKFYKEFAKIISKFYFTEESYCEKEITKAFNLEVLKNKQGAK